MELPLHQPPVFTAPAAPLLTRSVIWRVIDGESGGMIQLGDAGRFEGSRGHIREMMHTFAAYPAQGRGRRWLGEGVFS